MKRNAHKYYPKYNMYVQWSFKMTEIETKYRLTNWDLFKRIASISAAISGVFCVNYPQYTMYGIYYINTYAFWDLLFARRDMMVHHLLVLSFFAAITFHEFPEDYKQYFMQQLIRFEYSTIFYSGGPILLHYLSSRPPSKITHWIPTIKTVCQIGFAVTFFKVRIYDFAGNVIFIENTYLPDHFSSVVAFIHLISTTWMFYALNLYWFQLILFKMFLPENFITMLRCAARI